MMRKYEFTMLQSDSKGNSFTPEELNRLRRNGWDVVWQHEDKDKKRILLERERPISMSDYEKRIQWIKILLGVGFVVYFIIWSQSTLK